MFFNFNFISLSICIFNNYLFMNTLLLQFHTVGYRHALLKLPAAAFGRRHARHARNALLKTMVIYTSINLTNAHVRAPHTSGYRGYNAIIPSRFD